MTRFGKLLLALPSVLFVLGGCSKQAAAPEVGGTEPVPTSLAVTASRPAGTLDSLPDLTWSLQGNAGLSLVVRAQGPGASAPGVGFAGVRVASGPIRYLASNGTWSETEVPYAAVAGEAGTIHPTAPLRLEGEWRFDLIAKDATGATKAFALAPAVLTAAPSLRVSLSRQAAVEGDDVSGAVVLSQGVAAHPVRLLVWWQGPGGIMESLPASSPLAFDGPSADIRLPLLFKRLDGAAPGTWTLAARLFDAITGAPLGYGTQSLEVCGSAGPVVGTVHSTGGAPLGAGATMAQVQALGLDRPEGWTAAVDSTGAFILALRPGSWLVSGTVVDGSGVHRVEEVPVQVGCSVPPLLVLTALPPSAAPALMSPLDGQVAAPPEWSSLVAVPATAPAAECRGFGGKTRLRILSATTATLDAMSGNLLMPTWVEALKTELQDQTSGNLVIVTDRSLTGYAKFVAERMANGFDCTAMMESLSAMASDYAMVLSFVGGYENNGDKITFSLQLINVAESQVIRSNPVIRLPGAAAQQGGVVEAAFRPMVATFISSPSSIITYLRNNLFYPLEPRVELTASFISVTPGTRKTVTANLKDCDGTTYPDRTLYLERKPIPFPGEVTARTDASGNAQFPVELGASTRQESLRAYFVSRSRQSYYSETYGYGVNRGQLGQLRFSPGIPVIRPSTAAPVVVTSQDPATGAPQAGQRVVLESTLGGVPQSASGTTDGAGAVAVAIPVGGAVGLGQVDAYVPPPALRLGGGARAATTDPAPADPGRVTEYLVVTSPVAFNVEGPPGSVPAGAVVTLSGSLTLDGLPLAGTTVTLTSAGSGGSLSTATVAVDAAGGFELTFTPPPTGTGSATVTASVEVEGQQITRPVVISWTGTVPGDRLVFHGTMNVDGQVTLKVSKVEPLATTELFNVVRLPIPAGTPPPYFSPLFYLRQQNRMVGGVKSGFDWGWGFLDATGLVTIASPAQPYTIDMPVTVSSNGKFRVHGYAYEYCDLSLPEGSSPCTVTKAVVVYDNATGAVVDQLDPRLYGPFGLAEPSAVGPAGELLLPEFASYGGVGPVSTTWYLHKIGGATTAIGDLPVGRAAFSASGDKAYLGTPANLVEVVLATGVSRTLPPFGTSVADQGWAIELDGLLYVDQGDPEPRQLHRIDLASGQVTDVGALPAWGASEWGCLVP